MRYVTWGDAFGLVRRVGGCLVKPAPTVPGAARERRKAMETPRQRYVLVPRFRFAALELQVWARDLPSESVPDLASVLEELTVRRWRETFRALWLTAPRNPEDEEQSLQG